MATFKVGDVVVVIKANNYHQLLGRECCVVEIQPDRIWVDIPHPLGVANSWGFEDQFMLKKFPGEEQVMKLFTEVTKSDIVPA